MQLLTVLFASLLAVAKGSLLQSYSLPDKSPPTTSPLYPSNHDAHKGYHYQTHVTKCADGQVLHVDGRCVTPVITRSVYLFNVPQLPRRPTPLPYIPPPKIDHNILFVRLPETLRGPDPIVVPPPQQKNIVYVLKKKTQEDGPRVIEVPAPPKSNPDVYFVDYDHGENPILPTGEDLEGALAHDVQEIFGQVVDSGSASHAGNIGLPSNANDGSFGLVDIDSHLPVAGFGFQNHGHTGLHDIGLTGNTNDGSFGQVDIDSQLPVAGFGFQNHGNTGSYDSGVGIASHGSESVDFGNNQSENAASTSTPLSQGTPAPQFNYYLPPHQYSRY